MTAPELTLPPHYYTDPSIFAQESERIVARSWQMAGHRSQLPQPGDYLTQEVAGERLAIVHGRDGVLRAFYNVCQHRGHCLLHGAGNTGRAIACPYHRWTYELNGRLKRARLSEHTPGFDPGSIRLSPLALEDLCGFLFVNLDPETRPMDEVYPGLREEIAEYVPGTQALQYAHGHSALIECNWKAAVENYNECYHCRCVHGTFTRGVVDPETYRVQIEEGFMRHRALASKAVTYDADCAGNLHPGEYRSWYLWPFASIQCYPGGIVNTFRWSALSAGETLVWREWFLPSATPTVAQQQVIDLDRDTTFAEDLLLLRSVQRGLGSRGYHGGRLMFDPRGDLDGEHPVAHIKRRVLSCLDGAPGRLQSVG